MVIHSRPSHRHSDSLSSIGSDLELGNISGCLYIDECNFDDSLLVEDDDSSFLTPHLQDHDQIRPLRRRLGAESAISALSSHDIHELGLSSFISPIRPGLTSSITAHSDISPPSSSESSAKSSPIFWENYERENISINDGCRLNTFNFDKPSFSKSEQSYLFSHHRRISSLVSVGGITKDLDSILEESSSGENSTEDTSLRIKKYSSMKTNGAVSQGKGVEANEQSEFALSSRENHDDLKIKEVGKLLTTDKKDNVFDNDQGFTDNHKFNANDEIFASRHFQRNVSYPERKSIIQHESDEKIESIKYGINNSLRLKKNLDCRGANSVSVAAERLCDAKSQQRNYFQAVSIRVSENSLSKQDLNVQVKTESMRKDESCNDQENKSGVYLAAVTSNSKRSKEGVKETLNKQTYKIKIYTDPITTNTTSKQEKESEQLQRNERVAEKKKTKIFNKNPLQKRDLNANLERSQRNVRVNKKEKTKIINKNPLQKRDLNANLENL